MSHACSSLKCSANISSIMDFDYFEGRPEDAALEHRRRINLQIHERFRIRDMNNPFDMSINEFQRLFRMPQHAVMDLRNMLQPYVPPRRSPQHTSFLRKLLAALTFLGRGCYQRLIGRSMDCSMSQISISRAIREVVMALNHPDILTEHIKFPITREDRAPIIQRNEALGMIRVLGYIDGTLLKVTNLPRDNERQAYFTRKGWTGLNVQLIADSDLNILQVDARWPGSLNDNMIWEASTARRVVEQAYWEDRCWLLGDSGYFVAPWLHVPLPHAEEGTPEYEYTKLHCFCRNSVERCIGVLKGRWRCLCSDRVINYKNAAYAGHIVNACSVLHNFCLRRGLHEVDQFYEIVPPELPFINQLPADLEQLALFEQRFLINYAHHRRLLRDNLVQL